MLFKSNRNIISLVCVITFLFICFGAITQSHAGEPVSCKPVNDKSVIDFIPHELPPGWSSLLCIQVYGTSVNPSENGTIYDYINGGGVVYVDHGFTELAHVEYSLDNSDIKMTVDIFDMSKTENAIAAFSNENICPEGFEVSEIIKDSKAYYYTPDYFLYFQRTRFIVYIAVNDDSERETAEIVAASIQNLISREE